jgi:hypothetical protein
LTVRSLTGFAGAREEALIAVPGAIVTVEELRRDTFKTPNSRPTRPYVTPIALRDRSPAVGG